MLLFSDAEINNSVFTGVYRFRGTNEVQNLNKIKRNKTNLYNFFNWIRVNCSFAIIFSKNTLIHTHITKFKHTL